MLEANKSRVFENLFALYNRNLLKRRFHSLKVSGLGYLNERNDDLPLIIYANHSSWWDGLVAFQISRQTNVDAYVMMEEMHLKRLFPFRLLGAFSVVREKPLQAAKSVQYAAGLLTENTKRVLWIFPQGEILPNDFRPIRFYSGLARIIENIGKCAVVPLAMRYEFLKDYKPEIFVKIRRPEMISVEPDFKAKLLTKRLAGSLTDCVDDLTADIKNQNAVKYQSII